MDRMFSKEMKADAMQSAGFAMANEGIVEVSTVAEEVRLRHEHQNIAREDIEALVMECCTVLSAPMEISTFDDTASSRLVPLVAEPSNQIPLWGLLKSPGWGTAIRPREVTQTEH